MDRWRYLSKLKLRLFGPTSSYKVGDSVQLKDGGGMMMVIEVIEKRGLDQPLLYCQWYEEDTKATRQNLFRENMLTPFDWHQANRDTCKLIDA